MTASRKNENREACARLAPISPLSLSGSQSVSTGATVYDPYRAISFVWSGNRFATLRAMLVKVINEHDVAVCLATL